MSTIITINDSAVIENDSHLETLAGARVAGSAEHVKNYIFYFCLTLSLAYGKSLAINPKHNISLLSSYLPTYFRVILAGHLPEHLIMFDRIFDFVADVWEWLLPFVIVDQYERAIVLRLGKFKREVGPGLRWIWPLGIEDVRAETVVRQTAYLDPQSLTTSDGKSVTVAGIVIFTITNLQTYFLKIDDGETDMTNMVYGIISDCVEETPWQKIRGRVFNARVLKQAQAECSIYCGVKVIAIKWSDKAAARNLRLWND